MSAEYSSFAGWEKNLKLSNSFAELIVTVGVGPRIISYRPAEGRSVFKLVNDQAGKSNENEWKIRRASVWTAPEDFGKDDSLCYALDNSRCSTPSRMTLLFEFLTSSRSLRRSAAR